MKNTTIKDIAKICNVSTATVSRAINNPHSVKEETRKNVLTIIENTNFILNQNAATLKRKVKKTIAVIINDFNNPIYNKLLKSLYQVSYETEYNVVVFDFDNDIEKLKKSLNVIQTDKYAGIIFSSEQITIEIDTILKNTDIPVQLLLTKGYTDDDDYQFPYIISDGECGGYIATDYLINNKHSKIGMISGPENDLTIALPKCQGYISALNRHKLKIDNSIIAYVDFKKPEQVQDVILHWQKEKLLKEITAIFCASDLFALEAIKKLSFLNINVPKKISVIGFDNINFCELSSPPLTTIDQDFEKLGKTAFENIIKIINHEKYDSEIILKPELKVRASVRTLPNKKQFK